MEVNIETWQEEDGTWSFLARSDEGYELCGGGGLHTEQEAYDLAVRLC